MKSAKPDHKFARALLNIKIRGGNKMYKVDVILKNETGLHARPASLFITEASKHTSKITVIKDGKEYNGKSIMGILTMGAYKDDKITLMGEGEDEVEAVEALKKLVESGFGE